MKTQTRIIAAAVVLFNSVSLQAHEGHAAVGTMAHEIEHAGWVAGALMLVSVMILGGFCMAAKAADKILNKPRK